MTIERKLDKIIEQNNYMIGLLETMHDDAMAVQELQRRLNESRRTMRELEVEQYLKSKGYE